MALAQTTLAAAVTTVGQTAWTLTDVLGFPATATSYKGRVGSETVEVTAGVGTTSITVTRGVDGTTAATHLSGATFTYLPDAYADIADFKRVVRWPDSTDDLLAYDLLAQGAAWLDAKTERIRYGFHRHPRASGTETRTFDVSSSTNYLAVDLADAPTSVEVATSTGGTYVTLAATDYILDYASDGRVVGIFLSNVGSYTHFYPGYATVRIVGPFGFGTVPVLIERANIDVSAVFYRSGPDAGQTEAEDVNTGRMPLSVWDAINAHKLRRFDYVG